MIKRIFSAFLSILLLLSLCPAVSSEPLPPQGQLISGQSGIHTNPLYPESLSSAELNIPEHGLSPNADAAAHFGTVEEVASDIRGYLSERSESFTVYLLHAVRDEASAADEINRATADAFELALEHTGIGTEGDYLRWHWDAWRTEWSAGYTDEGYQVTIDFAVEYYTTSAQEQEMDIAVNDLLSRLDLNEATDYRKIRTIYDYLCENVTYDHAHLNDQEYTLKFTAYAALVDGTAVCQGYASLFYRLALELGVDARLIAGDAGGPHAWNIARLNDLYYNLDATWDAGVAQYRYFLVNDAHFTDHQRYSDYTTEAFYAAYPMSETDYDPETDLPHTHSYTANVKEPTCTDAGYTLHLCSCGHSYRDSEIPALGHVEVTDSAVSATCTENGLTEGTHCSRCSAVLTAQEVVQAPGHRWDEGRVTKEPTGSEPGQQAFTCQVCGGTMTESIPKLTNPFSDVHHTDYFFEPVLWASHRGITSGITASRFGPGESCTRAQVVTFLWRAAGQPEPQSAKNPFQDVKKSAFYYKAVLWAVEKGITSGVSPSSFSPNSPCTRAQVVTFLWRAEGQPEPANGNSAFTDVKSDAFYQEAVLWAVENGITTGTGANRFSPNQTCTRGQVVTFLYRAYH